MDYNDKLAIMAAILLAAKVQRGNAAADPEAARAAVKAARMLCVEIEATSPLPSPPA